MIISPVCLVFHVGVRTLSGGPVLKTQLLSTVQTPSIPGFALRPCLCDPIASSLISSFPGHSCGQVFSTVLRCIG